MLGQHNHVDQGLRVVWILLYSLGKSSFSLSILPLGKEGDSLAIEKEGSGAQLVNHLLVDVF